MHCTLGHIKEYTKYVSNHKARSDDLIPNIAFKYRPKLVIFFLTGFKYNILRLNVFVTNSRIYLELVVPTSLEFDTRSNSEVPDLVTVTKQESHTKIFGSLNV